MPHVIVHRADCDHPRCRARVIVPFPSVVRFRRELARAYWTLIRWQATRGKPGRNLYLCPAHCVWRPRSGRERDVPAVPTFPSRALRPVREPPPGYRGAD